MSLSPGTRLGPYEVTAKIGHRSDATVIPWRQLHEYAW